MKKILLGKVYANWCGHCQTLKPEWAKMKKELKSKMGNNIEFVEIEESEKGKLDDFKNRFKNLQVNGYPTIFKHDNGKFDYYQGNRTATEIGKWALGKSTNKNSKNFSIGGKKRKRKTNKHKTKKNITMVSRIKDLFTFGKK
jgi:thiol-disulfide isomerase/thioredoxin